MLYVIRMYANKFTVACLSKTNQLPGSPVGGYLYGLSSSQPNYFAKITADLDRYSKVGLSKNIEKVRTLGNGIWEFKYKKVRILFFKDRPKGYFVCTHVYEKQTQKCPPAEITCAESWREQYTQAKKTRNIRFI